VPRSPRDFERYTHGAARPYDTRDISSTRISGGRGGEGSQRLTEHVALNAALKLEPRGDDALFVGVVLLATVVAVRLWRRPLWLGILAAVVAVCCLLRLVLEAVGVTRGLLETLAPVAFLLLIAALSGLAFYGYPPRRSPDSGVHSAHSVDRRT